MVSWEIIDRYAVVGSARFIPTCVSGLCQLHNTVELNSFFFVHIIICIKHLYLIR